MTVVNCVVYEDGRRLGQVAVDSLSEHLAHRNRFVWLALAEPSDGELALVQQAFDLHELAIEDVRRGHQRPKVEEYDGFVFVVMHTIAVTDGLEIGELDVFVGPNFLVSVRISGKQTFGEVRQRVERNPELLRKGPAFALHALMDAVVDRYFPVVEKLEDEIERLEEQIFTTDPRGSLIEDLYAVKQKLASVKHATGSMLEAVAQLLGSVARNFRPTSKTISATSTITSSGSTRRLPRTGIP